ncbi:MAG: TetR/AcrR family transcriptional regulator [Hyphomicrobiales bacterium]|nr:TetR/AcrR family transcriptional regulator [Hyphomicrobiales bacterium]MCP5000900.1 TetR/AcrR family transcriptional regulator [Hyphomicrobiales bacterium]
MGRKRTIDRNEVLDAAETVVRANGPSALSIGAVAREAGISKGGVQSSFGTRDALIDAMFDRWDQDFDAQLAAQRGDDQSGHGEVKAYVTAVQKDMSERQLRNAAMLLLLAQTEAHRIKARQWYRNYFSKLDLKTEQGRRLRVAVLAIEGVFMLRSLGLTDFSKKEWDDLFDDILALTQ